LTERATSSARGEELVELASSTIVMGSRAPDWTWLMRSDQSATNAGVVTVGMGMGKWIGPARGGGSF